MTKLSVPESIIIVPARSNSKSIPNKNMRLLKGKPVLFYTLDIAVTALEQWLVNKVVFTTESEEYLKAVEDEYGKHVSIRDRFWLMKRDPSMAHDWVQNDDVVMDVIRRMEEKIPPKSTGILLQPTSPFREYGHLVRAIQLKRHLMHSRTGTLISGHMLNTKGFIWSIQEEDRHNMEPMGHDPTRRLGRQWDEGYKEQSIFKEDGSIYIFDWDTAKYSRTFRNPPFIPFITEPIVDLDEPEDWEKIKDERAG